MPGIVLQLSIGRNDWKQDREPFVCNSAIEQYWGIPPGTSDIELVVSRKRLLSQQATRFYVRWSPGDTFRWSRVATKITKRFYVDFENWLFDQFPGIDDGGVHELWAMVILK